MQIQMEYWYDAPKDGRDWLQQRVTRYLELAVQDWFGIGVTLQDFDFTLDVFLMDTDDSIMLMQSLFVRGGYYAVDDTHGDMNLDAEAILDDTEGDFRWGRRLISHECYHVIQHLAGLVSRDYWMLTSTQAKALEDAACDFTDKYWTYT